jgi:hypothetical protein
VPQERLTHERLVTPEPISISAYFQSEFWTRFIVDLRPPDLKSNASCLRKWKKRRLYRSDHRENKENAPFPSRQVLAPMSFGTGTRPPNSERSFPHQPDYKRLRSTTSLQYDLYRRRTLWRKIRRRPENDLFANKPTRVPGFFGTDSRFNHKNLEPQPTVLLPADNEQDFRGHEKSHPRDGRERRRQHKDSLSIFTFD